MKRLRTLMGRREEPGDPGHLDRDLIAARIGSARGSSRQNEGAPEGHREPGAGQHLLSGIDKASRQWRDHPSPPGAAASMVEADPSTPETLAAAVDHLDAKVSYVNARLEDLEPHEFPAIALLNDGSSFLVNRRSAGGYIVDDESGERTISAEALEARQSGTIFFVRPRALADTDEVRDEPFQDVSDGFDVFSDVVRHVWETRRRLFMQLIVASALSYAFLLALPLFTMAVYDRVVPHQAMETMWVLSIGVLLALALDFQLRFVRMKLVDAIGASSYLALQARFFRRVLNAQLVDAPRAPGPVAHQVKEIEQVCNLAPALMAAAVVDVPFFFILMGVLYAIGGYVVLAPLVGVIALGALYTVGHARTGSAIRKSVEISQKQSNQVFETVGALESVKAATAQSHLLRRWERISDEAGYYGHRARLWSGFATQSTLIVVQAVIVMVLIIGVYQIGTGAMSVGALAASSLLVGRMVAPVGSLIGQADRALQLSKSLGGLAQVLSTPQETPGDATRSTAQIRGGLTLTGVGFSYPQSGRKALEDIHIDIKPGERVGIIGRVGCGKSTLLRLALRLHQPETGSVLIDGQDIRQFPPHLLRRACGFMRQDALLFDDTLYNNICFGLDSVSDADFEFATEISGVAQMAAQLPEGYSTRVGIRGECLSGGERQMVSMARALVTRPNLLLMDEPTAAMDSALELSVIRRLKPALVSKTLILATHRIPALELVDRLIVMERGRIVADGPKQDVLTHLNRPNTSRPAQSA
ncbi:ATP-binding cassette domain-containing protein [Tepidamorphus sp. 3E244]|uniref:ATP-binding cassette domain-containing protein n=1 Tax=Tepidamorphus sp. 3E244 TaxID=3385498 RepID=UPI0038FC770E